MESAPEATPPLSAEPVPPEPIPEPIEKSFEKTVDDTHDLLQQSILDRVIRIDNFFGNTKTENQRKSEYQIRLRSSLRGEDGGKFEFGPSIRANIVLPKISERLRLTIAGDNEPAKETLSLPEDPGSPGFDRTAGSATKFVNTELRYVLIKSPSMDLFLGAGVRVSLSPKAFVRSRFNYTYHLSDISLLQFAETLFVRNPDGPGSTTELSLERFLNEKTLLRWSSTATTAYGIHGVEWGTELSWIRELSSKSAITVTGGYYGNTSFDLTTSSYRLLARYRRNFLKKWLFYEMEPEIFWPRTEDEQLATKYAFTFRFEVVLEGIAAK